MTLDKVEECSCDAKEMEECPEADKVDGKCPEVKQEAIPEWAKAIQTSMSSISGLAEKLAKLEVAAGVRDAPNPEATVSNVSADMVTIDNIAEKMQKAFSEGRDLKLEVPYEQVRGLAVSTQKVGRNGIVESYKTNGTRKHQIQEVGFTFTGTHTAIDQIPGVQTVPGGVDYAPLRQYTNYKVAPKGMSSATFYKKSLPDTLVQVPGTTVTESSMTYTAVNIAPSAIAGSYFKIDSDDDEDVPYSLAAETVDAIGQTVVDYEDTAIADTAAAAATPGLWINGNTGATITHDDISGMTLDPSAVGKGVAYLRTQGYLKGGMKPVLFAHPTAVDQLIRDGDLTNFTQFSNSGITQSGVFPELFGCTIVPTVSVATMDNTTNDTYRNILCVPGITFGSVSKRVLNVKFHEIPENNQIGVTANWRFKAGVIDASSLVRISSSQ
jgi:hypothetical protein